MKNDNKNPIDRFGNGEGALHGLFLGIVLMAIVFPIAYFVYQRLFQ